MTTQVVPQHGLNRSRHRRSAGLARHTGLHPERGMPGFTSRYNSDPSLSAYAFIPGNVIVDAGMGLGRSDDKFDFSVLVKNGQQPGAFTPAVPDYRFANAQS
jgi:hypothetical protein